MAFKSQGCFVAEALEQLHASAEGSNSAQSPALCADACVQAAKELSSPGHSVAFAYFSLHSGTQCTCGTGMSFGAQNLKRNGCDLPCGGDSVSMCGSKSDDSLRVIYSSMAASSASSDSTTILPPKGPTTTFDNINGADRPPQSTVPVLAISLTATCGALLLALGVFLIRRKRSARRALIAKSLGYKHTNHVSSISNPSSSSIYTNATMSASIGATTSKVSLNNTGAILNQSHKSTAALLPSGPPSMPSSPGSHMPLETITLTAHIASSLSDIVPSSAYLVRQGYVLAMNDELTLNVHDTVLVEEAFDDGWGSGTVIARAPPLISINNTTTTIGVTTTTTTTTTDTTAITTTESTNIPRSVTGVFPLACLIEPIVVAVNSLFSPISNIPSASGSYLTGSSKSPLVSIPVGSKSTTSLLGRSNPTLLPIHPVRVGTSLSMQSSSRPVPIVTTRPILPLLTYDPPSPKLVNNTDDYSSLSTLVALSPSSFSTHTCSSSHSPTATISMTSTIPDAVL